MTNDQQDRITDALIHQYEDDLNRDYNNDNIQTCADDAYAAYQDDWDDYIRQEGYKSPEERAYEQSLLKLQALTIDEMLNLEVPPREDILSPILQTQSLNMLFAKRGVGKTHVALGLSYAIASGGAFLKWQAAAPRKVLYIDGEMPAATMQSRLRAIRDVSTSKAAADYLRIVNPDVNRLQGMPDLSTADGQMHVQELISDAELVVVDNISTLSRTGNENEAESWSNMQTWALGLRAMGKSVLFVHHAGKGVQQRGTSRREDVLDTVIELRHPNDYDPEQGARFEVHFTKARNLSGEATKPFEAHLHNGVWTFKDAEDVQRLRAEQLKQSGFSIHDIQEEMGISRATAYRLLQKTPKG